MSEADSFRATVRFFSTEEGGRRRPPRNPAVSQLRVAEVQLSCLVVAIDENGDPLAAPEFELGQRYRVRIVVPTICHYDAESPDPEVELFDGPKQVADGLVEGGARFEATPAHINRFIADAWG